MLLCLGEPQKLRSEVRNTKVSSLERLCILLGILAEDLGMVCQLSLNC